MSILMAISRSSDELAAKLFQTDNHLQKKTNKENSIKSLSLQWFNKIGRHPEQTKYHEARCSNTKWHLRARRKIRILKSVHPATLHSPVLDKHLVRRTGFGILDVSTKHHLERDFACRKWLFRRDLSDESAVHCFFLSRSVSPLAGCGGFYISNICFVSKSRICIVDGMQAYSFE